MAGKAGSRTEGDDGDDETTVVQDLTTASRSDLGRLWTELHGCVPPRSISQPLLRRILAFDLQLRAAGGWPAGLQGRIEKAGRQGARPVTASPLAGGRLLREWNGTTHVVEVIADGFLWQGRSWRSLSAIARAITGAHWSGPRFFGLAEGDDARGRRAKSGRKSSDPNGTNAGAKMRTAQATTRTPRSAPAAPALRREARS